MLVGLPFSIGHNAIYAIAAMTFFPLAIESRLIFGHWAASASFSLLQNEIIIDRTMLLRYCQKNNDFLLSFIA
jgi:hypothetical protein